MATNLKSFEADPLDEKDEKKSDSKPVSKRRKRRTKKEIEADNLAQSLGYKDAADQAEQEAKMGEAPKEREPGEVPGEGPTLPREGEQASESKYSPRFQLGDTWNLGGQSYTVIALTVNGNVTFAPACDGS